MCGQKNLPGNCKVQLIFLDGLGRAYFEIWGGGIFLNLGGGGYGFSAAGSSRYAKPKNVAKRGQNVTIQYLTEFA